VPTSSSDSNYKQLDLGLCIFCYPDICQVKFKDYRTDRDKTRMLEVTNQTSNEPNETNSTSMHFTNSSLSIENNSTYQDSPVLNSTEILNSTSNDLNLTNLENSVL
jgi:hypothetical protein